MSAYSSNISKFYSDNYVYIRGAPEASIWNTDGTSTDYAAILPRNRGYGMHLGAADAYIADRTSVVKTSLNSLRVMRL